MDLAGYIVLVLGGAVLGLIGQVPQGRRIEYEWIVTGIGAIIGGYVASELLGTAGEWGPAFGGLFVVPALIGGAILGAIVWIVLRNVVSTSAPRAA